MNTILPYFRMDTDSLWQSMPNQAVSQAFTFLDDKAQSLRAKLDGPIGFYHWPDRIPQATLQEIDNLAQRLRRDFAGAVIFGIGGSYLGPATIVESLSHEQLAADGKAFPILWLSNADSSEVRRIERAVKGKKYAAIVISKSGNTVETLSAFFHLSHYFDPAGVVTITDPTSGELRGLSKAQNWKCLDVPADIGGRFSVLTAVGLLPTALAGLSSDDLIGGAKRMRHALESTQPAINPAYRLALAHYLWDVHFGRSIHVFMPYEKRLKYFADWWVQLFGESLGKKQSAEPRQSVGFTPLSALGSTDQHSLLQLFKEGPPNKVVGFLSVYDKENALPVSRPTFYRRGDGTGLDYLFNHSFDAISHFACLATERSLQNSATPTFRIEISRLDESTLGALFFFFETVCAFAGELYGVDAFNQPGVEEAKLLLRQSLV